MNDLNKTMMTKIEPSESLKNSRRRTLGLRKAAAAAKWIRKHKQTNNGKTFEKI